MELKDKHNIEKITFETFIVLNAHFPEKTSTFGFLTCALRGQDNILLTNIINLL